ncbi:MAG: BREX system ATP-binding domain-containing protein [Candidatus Paceibacterota bacterium]
MGYLVFIFVTLALLAGFFVLTSYEARRGVRVYAAQRARLDKTVERVEFILQNVDLGAFLRTEVRHLVARLSHDIAHLSLQAVRATERLLTRLVMHLRSKHSVDTAPRGNVREFVKTLSDFKGGLKATHPEVGEIK